MQTQGAARRVTVYAREGHSYQGRPLHVALLEFLRGQGALGATVTKGVAGFGAGSRIHTATIVALSADLPVKIEWVDHVERIDTLLPAVRAMVGDGLITIDPIEVVQYALVQHPDPWQRPVGTVMRSPVTSVTVDTPLASVISLLIDGGYRSVPVQDAQGHAVGIITDGDLIEHANLLALLGLYGSLPAEEIRRQFTEIEEQALTAASIMSTPLVTVEADDTLRKVAVRMDLHGLKRIPVVDAEQHLLGLVTRLDLLRALDDHGYEIAQSKNRVPRQGQSVIELMNSDPPVVAPSAPLEEILIALESSNQQRVLVVDSNQHVIGIITDGDILRRSQERLSPSLWQRLRGLVRGAESVSDALTNQEERAVDLMTAPVFTIGANTSLDEALRLMLRHQIKRLPVLNEQKELIGLLGRASLLNGLMGMGEEDASEESQTP